MELSCSDSGIGSQVKFKKDSRYFFSQLKDAENPKTGIRDRMCSVNEFNWVHRNGLLQLISN